jgi:hypothetical protein
MANELALSQGFGAVSSLFGGNKAGVNDELGAGVNSSYGIVGIKGKVWSIRFAGEEKQLMRDDGDGPRNSVEVVLLKASPAISKIFYKNGYVDGANAAPDCWSADGIKPDSSVQAKCHSTCADCPMNAWGSRVTDAGKQGKQCADSRRVAVVPSEDMDNDLFGGPMLLRIPAASLKDLKAYGDLLSSYQYPYYGAVTRIAFDSKEAFPKLVFNAVRPLTDAEAAKVLKLREDKRVSVVLSETAATVGADNSSMEEKKDVSSSPFEQDAPKETVKEVAKAPVKEEPKGPTPEQIAADEKRKALAAKKAAAAEAAKKAAEEAARLAALAEEDEEEIDEETGEVTSAGTSVASFDDMLDKIL